MVKSEFVVENYCKMIMSLQHWAVFCKFGSMLERGRYEIYVVETEKHVIFFMYDSLKETLFQFVLNIEPNFLPLSETKQVQVLLTNPTCPNL